nr:hypothetical protein CFP56_24109 [Quercus suber]
MVTNIATSTLVSSLTSNAVSTTTSTTGSLTATLDDSSTATQTQSSTGIATDSPTDLGASGLQPSASPLASASSSKGLSQKEQIGIGVGVGIGVPLIIGLLAALYFISRRRQNKASDRTNPYGPVYASDKAAIEDGNDHSEPQESHPMNSSATPFLPVPVSGGLQHHDEHEHDQDHDFEPRHESMVDPAQSHTIPFRNDTRVQSQPPDPLTVPTTPSHIRTSEPTLAQQARESYRAHTPIEDAGDEPPSPVSPVSPVSEMGSRPASLHSQHHNHDL